jgi:hypothetical protein
MSGYVQDEAAAFDRSRACFETLVAKLAGPQTSGHTHAQLEDLLHTGDGRELLRTLHQDRLDLQAAREQRQQITDADGVARTRTEHGHQRGLATMLGQVTVTRMAYRRPEAPNLYPMDAALNLPTGKHSHGLRRLAALESTRDSFDHGCDAIERATGVRIGKRQVEALAQAAAVDIEAFYIARRPGPAPDHHLLVMQFDGKGIVMIPQALREATAKAAAQAQRKLRTRLSPGEKNNRKRMAEVAAVYDAAPAPRTPTDVITPPGTNPSPARARGPKATGKWLTASVTHDIREVIAAGFDEAARRDPTSQRTWVVLVDGNRTQIDAIRAEASRRGVNVHIVLDFIHVVEYLWKAAWSFFYTGDPAAETWVAEQAHAILQGKAAQVAAGIRRRATRFGYSTTERAGADTCADYLTAKKPYLAYHTALTSGWPIATGVIEGACRHLVKDRMDITGARWSLTGAEAILRLRALVSNGDFEEYWDFHQRQEHKRIHETRYRHHRGQFTLAA